MRTKTIKRLIDLITVSALVIACSNSDSDSTNTMTVSPSLGLINAADVRLLDLSLTQISDTIEQLDASGQATLTYPSSHTAPIIVEVVGNAVAEYFDESTQSFRPFEGTNVLRAILDGPQSEVGITALTEVATQRVESLGFGTATASSINAVNTQIRDAFAQGIADITLPPTIVGAASDQLGDSVADLYGLFLAALTELASGESSPALAIMGQLAEDLRDGNFDGLLNGNALVNSIISLQASNFNSTINPLFIAALAQYGEGSVSQQDLIDFVNEPIEPPAVSERVCPTGGSPADTMLPSLLVNSQFDLVLSTVTQAGFEIFDENQDYPISVDSQGLFAAEIFPQSNDPYTCGDDQSYWFNESENLVFSISIFGNNFNELNIFLADGTFVAQGTIDSSSSSPANLNLVTDLAGSYNVTATQGSHNRGTVEIQSNGGIDFDTGISFTLNDIVEIFDRTSIANEPRVQVNYGADDDAEAILIYLTPGNLEQIDSIQFRDRNNSIDTQVTVDNGGNSGGETMLNLSGNVSGIDPGAQFGDGQWELSVNGIFANDGQLNNGAVTYNFASLMQGDSYQVFINGQQNHTCMVANATGTVGSTSVDNIDISCTPN